jgi:hypothetical protein
VAKLFGNLWEFNLARVVFIDVTDDYRYMQPPMPSECYPVLDEIWLPTYRLVEGLPTSSLIDGYLYDWHEMPPSESEPWYVGVVRQDLAQPLAQG